jgi:hypothetical protein
MNNYDVGNLVVLTVNFQDANNNFIDPTAVALVVKTPDGTLTTFTPTRVSTGVYSYNFTLVQAGIHYYRYTGTGAVTAAADGSFFSTPSPTLSD